MELRFNFMASVPCHSRHTDALVLHVPTGLVNSSIQKTSNFAIEKVN